MFDENIRIAVQKLRLLKQEPRSYERFSRKATEDENKLLQQILDMAPCEWRHEGNLPRTHAYKMHITCI